jgi:tagatose-1,6-bisphosphate aldolase non-catalytic subunit AgaZ/GatZ
MTDQYMPLRDLVVKLREAGRKCTLLCVGPVSEVVVKATFQTCEQHACPAIFIASRNQVDLRSLGHGYLMGGIDQHAFAELLGRLQKQVGYEGPVYMCRDHGGPWQRNAELDERYPVARAMEIARESFRADIEAGFNYLHIDPTKCPFPHTQEDLCDWTTELERFCEETRKALGRCAIDYEVGTEDIRGGLTDKDTFESFLRHLTRRLEEQGLPLPTCVVGQTGTLCRMDRNVGHFDRVQTEELVAIAARYGVGFKEHNGDYLSAASCRIHPDIGVTGVNVAPEFGLVETDGCLTLADLEMKLVREGWLAKRRASHFRELLLERTFTDSPWVKWMTKELGRLPREHLADDQALRLLIARVCGHYVYNDSDVKTARCRLYENVDRFDLAEGGAERFVIDRVRDAIEFYLRHFRLMGINAIC